MMAISEYLYGIQGNDYHGKQLASTVILCYNFEYKNNYIFRLLLTNVMVERHNRGRHTCEYLW